MPPGTTEADKLEAYECVAATLHGVIGMAQIEVDARGSKAWERAVKSLRDALRDLEEIKPREEPKP